MSLKSGIRVNLVNQTLQSMGLFGSCFQELSSVLENKKHKKLVWEKGCVFIFCVFYVLKNHFFFIIIKRCFHCFFIIHRIYCFSCFLSLLFVFS